MKKKVYNQESLSSIGKTALPAISFGKAGVVYFNRPASEMLNLEKNKISVVQDEANPKDWYIQIDNKNGIKSRPQFEYPKSKNIVKGHIFNSKALCEDFQESIGFVFKTATARLCSTTTEIEGEKYYAILTKSVK